MIFRILYEKQEDITKVTYDIDSPKYNIIEFIEEYL